MAKNRNTKKWLKNHWTYSWWKYLLLVVLSVMGVNMVFTMTAYRPPEEKKIEVFVLNGYIDSMRLKEELDEVFFAEHPDQEELTIYNINLGGGDMYASMQFSVYTAAQQGDVCLIKRSDAERLAAEGADYAFMELTPYIESGVIDVTGIDMTSSVMTSEDGREGIYCIPADTLYGLLNLSNDPADSVLCIFDYNGNEENSAAILNLMIEKYHTEKPQGYDEMRESQQNQSVLF